METQCFPSLYLVTVRSKIHGGQIEPQRAVSIIGCLGTIIQIDLPGLLYPVSTGILSLETNSVITALHIRQVGNFEKVILPLIANNGTCGERFCRPIALIVLSCKSQIWKLLAQLRHRGDLHISF